MDESYQSSYYVRINNLKKGEEKSIKKNQKLDSYMYAFIKSLSVCSYLDFPFISSA